MQSQRARSIFAVVSRPLLAKWSACVGVQRLLREPARAFASPAASVVVTESTDLLPPPQEVDNITREALDLSEPPPPPVYDGVPPHALRRFGDDQIRAPTEEDEKLERSKAVCYARDLINKFHEMKDTGWNLTPKSIFVHLPTEDEIKRYEAAVAQVRDTFYLSVRARTIGNFTLRQFIQMLSPQEWKVGADALEGARDGGLRITSQSYESLMKLILDAKQIRLAMILYKRMIADDVPPLTTTYNYLMKMSLAGRSPLAAQKLFDDMRKRGQKPNLESYELLIHSYAMEEVPQWQKAVAVFDRLQRDKSMHINSNTYNAIMTVYLHMSPFDYRVVFRAYDEMRRLDPPIQHGWESYLIVAAAFRKGCASPYLRIQTFLEAWAHCTEIYSVEFFRGWLVYYVLLLVLGYLGAQCAGVLKRRVNPTNFDDPMVDSTAVWR